MGIIIRHFKMQPHGAQLLTSSAEFWLLSARVLVAIMALSEAAAWGYLGSLFGDGSAPILVGAVVATTIFLVVWMIDVSLLSLDRAWAEHSRTILGQVASIESKKTKKLREIFSFVLRIGLLFGSLTITAPYLAQLVFYQDIEQITSTQATTVLDQKRQALAFEHERAITNLAQDVETKRRDYEREVAGRGQSGRYGNGAAAKALKGSVEQLQMQLAERSRARDEALASFDTLARDWRKNRQQLGARYNVILPERSVLQNGHALNVLRQRPEHRTTELAIKAFLAFIFAGLLLLKLFEPASVRLYFSEVLQQEYERYKTGAFDNLLSPNERSMHPAAVMPPQRLYAFLVDVWAPARQLEQEQASMRARTGAARQSLETLQLLRADAQNELDENEAIVQKLRKSADQTNTSLIELRSAIDVVRRDVDACSTDLANLDNDADADEFGRFRYRTHLTKRREKALVALRTLEESVPTEEERHSRAKAALMEAERRLQASRRELDSHEESIREVRTALLEQASEKTRSIAQAG